MAGYTAEGGKVMHIGMMNRIFVLMAALFLFFTGAAAAGSADTYVGMGDSRRAAILDAQRMALEANGVLVHASTQTQNFRVIDDRIYSVTGGFIESYSISRVSQTGDGAYFAVITNVKIGREYKDSYVDQLTRKRNVDINLGNPRIGIVISGATGGTYSGRSIFEKEFRKHGFQLYDTEQMAKSMNRTAEVAKIVNDMALLENLSQLGVDYLCVVDVLASTAYYHRSSHSGEAEVFGEILDTHTGAILATSQRTQGQGLFDTFGLMDRSANNARMKAEKRAMQNVAEELCKELSKHAASVSNTIEVNMTASYRTFESAEAARAWMASLPGVQNAFVRSSYYGSIILDVRYSGTASDLVHTITNTGREAYFSNNKIIM